MDFNAYTVTDFVTDESFINWVKNPDEENEQFWQHWVNQNPHKKDIIEEAREIILFLGSHQASSSDMDFSEVKSNIFKQIQDDKKVNDSIPFSENFQDPVLQNRINTRTGFNYIYFKAAAVFIGLLLISFALYFQFSQPQIIYTTAYGETKSIVLPDSSIVVLNSNSTLTIPSSWNKKESREIWLEGEAFFNVQKIYSKDGLLSEENEENIKFIVHANNLEVEVVGTRFNVNNRRDLVKVVLNSGQINLNARNERISMKPGDMVEFSPSKEIYIKKTVEAEKLTSWRHKLLIFEDASISEIAQVIEDNYGLYVEFGDKSLSKRRFTGALPYQDIDLLITVLAESLNLKINKTSEKIKIDIM